MIWQPTHRWHVPAALGGGEYEVVVASHVTTFSQVHTRLEFDGNGRLKPFARRWPARPAELVRL